MLAALRAPRMQLPPLQWSAAARQRDALARWLRQRAALQGRVPMRGMCALGAPRRTSQPRRPALAVAGRQALWRAARSSTSAATRVGLPVLGLQRRRGPRLLRALACMLRGQRSCRSARCRLGRISARTSLALRMAAVWPSGRVARVWRTARGSAFLERTGCWGCPRAASGCHWGCL